ncbi:MAG: hypothetical protein KIT28_11415 [Rubrivivax sp.]|nr:hypothetical protein [Rubrivivax sp.]
MKHEIRWFLGAAVAAGAAALLLDLRKKRSAAADLADGIETQIADLDPATRAAVIGRLTKDALDAVRNRS